LTASPSSSTSSNMSDALWHLAHINIVDNLFIGRLQGHAMPSSSTTTGEQRSIADLSFKFNVANNWFVN
jgi:hypothetical protein